MTKNISTLLFLIVLSFFSANATNPNPEIVSNADKNAAKAANAFCNCINNFMGDLHPSLTTFTIDMRNLGIDAAQEKFTQYLMTLSQSELLKINKDAEKMSQISGESLIKSCKLTKYEKYLNDEKNNAELMKQFEKNKDCELAKMFLEIGESLD